MEAENEPLDELADAVLEGHSVDWASAESSAGAPDREAVRQLKVLAVIAALHRNLTRDSPEPGWPEAPEGRLERWGRLEILERIGRGSFGEVYRAWDSKLDREVAVKLLHSDGGQPEGATVLKEARLLARVRHPNVVTVYDADESEGRVGLWMEFIHGRNLEQVLGQKRNLSEKEVIRIGIDLCRALGAVHDAGLLHRDIKTQNVMQAEDGRLVLMDFGTGRESGDDPFAEVDAAGTPLYLAPEIFAGALATVGSDVYSAGVLLFHLLTGVYPVRGSTIGEVRSAHSRDERAVLPSLAPRVSRALAAAIDRAIQPDPARRFESARSMLDAFEKLRRGGESHRQRNAWIALSSVSLIAGVLVLVSGSRGREPGRNGQVPGTGPAYFGSTAQKRAVHTPNCMIPGTPSPDGRLFPCSEAGTGNLALYEFATGVSRVLTRTGDGGDANYATEAVVSPDGLSVAYGWEDGSCACSLLRIIDADGGNERTLYGGAGQDEVLPREWSSDGSVILGLRRMKGRVEIVLVSAADAAVHVIRSTAPGLGRVTLSPDGRLIAYDRVKSATDSNRGIYLAPIDGGPEVPLVTGPTFDSDPMWTADGFGIVFLSLRTGGPSLWLQPIENGSAKGGPRLLDKEMGPFAPITLTKSGSLFYNHRTGLMDVYTAAIDPATGAVVGEPSNAASHIQGSNIYADWSPDGQTLAFASWRTKARNILVFHSLETGTEREIELEGVANGVHWSPDGRSVAVGAGLVDPESGSMTPTHLGPHNSFVWDPDGRHAFIGRLGGERPGIFRADVLTGEETTLYEPPSASVLGNLSLSPDGRWLAFGLALQPTKTAQLLVVSTGGGRPRELFSQANAGVAFGVGEWTRDGRRILFVRTTPDAEQKHVGELWAVSLDGEPPQRLGLSMRALRDVRVSPDGVHVSFTSGYPETDLWVFENFLPKTPAH